MNRIALIAMFGLLIVFGANAQKNNLKGPAYKNRKLWKSTVATTQVFTMSGETLKGPEAKNSRPLERKSGEKVLVALGGNTESLMGPEYKNRKPWETLDTAVYAKDQGETSGQANGMSGSL